MEREGKRKKKGKERGKPQLSRKKVSPAAATRIFLAELLRAIVDMGDTLIYLAMSL